MPPLGLYIHWPFCRKICPYCDFNRHVASHIDYKRWQDALLLEMDYVATLVPERHLVSLFFGGGTPSTMPPDIPRSLIQRARTHWMNDETLEITLEANPTSSDKSLFQSYAQAGVNRLSLGLQALNDKDLRFLGRDHNHEMAIAALKAARSVFPRVSVDLIYARPNQTISDWRAELEYILPHLGDHLSLYQLTIAKGTPFYSLHRSGRFTLPDDDLAADLYEASETILATAGYHAYEISNYAKPGGICRHNTVYWRYGEYGGIGPGAHSRLKLDQSPRHALTNIRKPASWLNSVEQKGHALAHRTRLDKETIRAEYLMMGLRLTRGIDLAACQSLLGDNPLDPLSSPLARLIESGDLSLQANRLAATPQGRLRLDAVLSCLLRNI